MNRRGFFQGLAAVATALGVPNLGAAAEKRWGVINVEGTLTCYFPSKPLKIGTYTGHTMFLDKSTTVIFREPEGITLNFSVEEPNE